ncbi:MAG: hypothetical protein ACI8RZ_003118 [Myxococcota bacterium]|jgi:hypothetical protein
MNARSLAIYALLALLATAPAWVSGGLLIGGGDQPDWTGTMWAYWWTGEALTGGHNPFAGDANFFPIGVTAVAQYNLLDALLFWPLLVIFGPILGYNLAAIATLVSSAVGGQVLARRAGVSATAAIFSGAAVEVSSFMLLEVTRGRLSQALLVFWLLALAGILRIVDGEGGRWVAVGTGMLAAAASLTYWYYGLFLLFAALPLIVCIRRWKDVGRLVAAGAVCLAVTGPYVYSLITRYDALPGVTRKAATWMDYGSLARGEFGLSMAISQSRWPWWPLSHAPGEPDDTRLPIVLLVAAAVGVRAAGRRGLVWLAVAGLGWLLTLGPYLKDAEGVPQRLALPYLWLHDLLPSFDRLWWPQRLEILPLAALAVLAGLGLSQASGRVVAAAVVALMLDVGLRSGALPATAAPPRPVSSAIYDAIDGPVVTTPVLSEDELVRHVLWMQVHHRQPILGGLGEHLPSHRPPGYTDHVQSRRLLRALERMSVGTFRDFIVYPRDVDELLEDGFRWVVVDEQIYGMGLEEAWAAAFSHILTPVFGPPDITDGISAAWRITPIEEEVFIPEIPAVEIVGTRRSDGTIQHRVQTAEGRERPSEPPEE